MSSLLVVTGPPGAGKSTVGRILADRYEPSVLVVGDAFFQSWPGVRFSLGYGIDPGFRSEGATRTLHRELSKAGIDPRHVLVDSPDQPEDVADVVVTGVLAESWAYRGD